MLHLILFAALALLGVSKIQAQTVSSVNMDTSREAVLLEARRDSSNTSEISAEWMGNKENRLSRSYVGRDTFFLGEAWPRFW
jgi:hypothetical protein